MDDVTFDLKRLNKSVWACGRSLAGIVVSNPARGMDVCPLRVLGVVR